MARLIEVDEITALPLQITIGKADILLLKATGVRVVTGSDFVEVAGPLMPGIIVEDGQILSPMGSPNTIILIAREHGKAQIEVVTGDPFFAPVTTRIKIVIG